MTSFSPPTLKPDEIIEFVTNGIDCENNAPVAFSVSDLTQPKPEKIQTMYTLLFEEITEKRVDDLSQPSIFSTDYFEYPEIHESALRLTNLSLCLKNVLSGIGVDDFSVFDLVEPKPKRTIRNLSALINFLKWMYGRVPYVEHLKEERARMEEAQKTLINENDDLKRKIEKIKSRKAESEPECNQLEHEIEELGQRISGQQQTNSGLQQKIYEKEKDLGALNSAHEHIINTLKRVRDICEKLSHLIVVSPDRVKSEEEHMRVQLRDMKEHRTMLFKQEAETVAKVKEKQQTVTECEPLLTLLDQLKTSYEEQLSLNTQLESLNDQKATLTYNLKKISANAQQQKEILFNMNAKADKLNLQYRQKINSLNDMKNNVTGELEKLRNKKDLDEQANADVKKNMMRLETEINKKMKSHQDSIQMMKDKYAELLLKIDEYHSNLGDAWSKHEDT